MHQFVTLSRGSGPSGGEEEEVVTYEDPETSTTTTLIATTPGGNTVNMNSLGSHFLTDPDELEQSIGKIEVETMPIEVVVKKKEGLLEREKKVCLWPVGSGMSCGKTFSKFDNLKRHLAEAHKGSRPFACNLCDKSYGRKDYLQRHLKSHYSINITPPTSGASSLSSNNNNHSSSSNNNHVLAVSSPSPLASQHQQEQQHASLSDVLSKVQMTTTTNTQPKNILVQVQQPHSASVPSSSLSPQFVSQQPSHPPLPMFNVQLTGGSISKPGGSKICRWVQNDGTVCGKAFSKLDSLRRHVTELHKGVRPYACNLCDKNYGRRDYLERHMRTHDANNAHKKKAGPIDWGPNSTSGTSGGVTVISGGLLATSPGGAHPEASIVARIPKKKRKDIPAEEKKICLWVLEDGTACGKTFTKFDSLKRHVSEAHKGIRPYACTLCGKNYGRRDYLLRHLKSHNEADTSGANRSTTTTTQLVVGASNGLSFASSSGASHPTAAAVLQQVVTSSPQLVRSVSSTSQLMSLESSAFATTTTSPSVPVIHHHHQHAAVSPLSNGAASSSISHHQTLLTTSSGNSSASSSLSVSPAKKRNDDKKTCRWVLENGTVCGRNFSKFDSLRRHVQELHKGIRPFVCSLCDKSYGRRDYLQRHMKSHDNDSIALSVASPTTVVVTQ